MSFGRRTWNREDYIGTSSTDSSPSFTDDELTLLKKKYTNYHALMQTASTSGMNHRTLVSAASVSAHKRGKQFGFYCELCDLTFKDTLQYIDHLNHMSHVARFEKVFGETLVLDTRDNDDIPIDEFRESYLAATQQFVKEHGGTPKSKHTKKTSKVEKSTTAMEESSDMAKIMGFGSFGTSKK